MTRRKPTLRDQRVARPTFLDTGDDVAGGQGDADTVVGARKPIRDGSASASASSTASTDWNAALRRIDERDRALITDTLYPSSPFARKTAAKTRLGVVMALSRGALRSSP